MGLRRQLEEYVIYYGPLFFLMAGVGWLIGKAIGFVTGKRKDSGRLGVAGGFVGALVSMLLIHLEFFPFDIAYRVLVIGGLVGACVLAALFSKKVRPEGEDKGTGEGAEPVGELVRPGVALTLRQAFIGTCSGVKANLLPLTGTFILSLVLAGLLGFCVTFLGEPSAASRPGLVGIVLFYFFASSLLVVGWVSISLKIVRGQKPGVSDLFTGFRKIIPIMGVLIFFISGSFLPGELLRQGSLFGLEQPFFLEGFRLFPIADPVAFVGQVWMGGFHDELFSEGWLRIAAPIGSFWYQMNSFLVGLIRYRGETQGSFYVLNPFAFIFNSTAFFSLWVIADKNKGVLASISSVLRIAWGNKLYLFLLSLTLWGIWIVVNILSIEFVGETAETKHYLHNSLNPFPLGSPFPAVAFKAFMVPLVFIFMAHVYEGISGERTARPTVVGKEEAATSASTPDVPLDE